MVHQLWCKVCEQAVDTTVARSAALLAVPLAGALGAAIPRLTRRRLGLAGPVLQAALGTGAAYLAQRYVVPMLQVQVCGRCGSQAVPHSAAA